MKLSLLISKRNNEIICSNDYKIGWFMKDETKGYWTVWGSCKDLKDAFNCVKNVIKEKGKREIYLSSVPLDKNLTLGQIANLEDITQKFE